MMSNIRSVLYVSMLNLLFLPASIAAPITSNNILVSTNNVLYEYTAAGSFVQSFQIPDGAGTIPNSDTARDVAIKDGTTQAYVYNGTFTPSMSTLDSSTGAWTHDNFAGLSTVNNVSYGGIAGGGYVFVTDMATAGAGAPQGIVRFDSDGSATRFATGIGPQDLNIGQDGRLYALANDDVHVYDPASLAFQYSIDLDATIGSGDYRAVAANVAGDLFIVDWSGNLYKTNASGTVLLSVNLSGIAESTNLTDVDVSGSGTVVVGDSFGGVTITNEFLTAPTSFAVGSSPIFVAVAGVPYAGLPVSPLAIFILAVTLALVAMRVLLRFHAVAVR
ncbi:MAG: hypothetical protein IT366_11290 [Candidatus Hydrogenedentes bacterium]|nr:hypothetical protein [Candidatus Hydrogenedentota bacterium]